MSDPKEKSQAWGTTLVGRLCLFGWISVILYECFDFVPSVRQVFLAVGPWICLLAFLHALVFLCLHRQGIFIVLMLVSLPPTIYFGIVLRNIAVEQQISSMTKSSSGELPAAAGESKR